MHDVIVRCDLDPDLSTVFEDLLGILTSLCQDIPHEVELAFYEQGTDLTLWLQRHGADLYIRFAVGDQAGTAFQKLPAIPTCVPATMFLDAWQNFLRDVLTMLTTLEPALAQEPGYQAYRAQIERIVAH